MQYTRYYNMKPVLTYRMGYDTIIDIAIAIKKSEEFGG